MFPQLAADIDRVQQDPSFHLNDLRWIAPVLGGSIRVTIDQGVWRKVSTEIPWVTSSDMFFGEGQLVAHLFYSWPKAQEESRFFGHYDLVLPTENTLFSLLLPPDATRPEIAKTDKYIIYIYIYEITNFYHCYIYIHIYHAVFLERIWEHEGCDTHSNLLATCLGGCDAGAISSSTLAGG